MARLFLTFIVLLLSTASCTTPSSSANPFDRQQNGKRDPASRMDLMVRVQNEHFDFVRVSAVWGKTHYYLGDVPPGETDTYRLPGHLLESLGGPRFLANPKGSANEQLTDPVSCEQARWVEWRVKRHLLPSRPRVMAP